jgi:unsaturated chondroitin disaccharide hydrolase
MASTDVTTDRVQSIADTVGDRFPLYADSSGVWRTTRRGSWAAGCWVGLLWLRANRSGATSDIRAAEEWARRLDVWTEADTATQGLIFWYGAAIGSRLGLSEAATPLARKAADSMRSRFDPDVGVIPWGTAFGDTGLRARVDGVAGTVPLLAWAGETEVAAAHLRTHLGLRTNPAWQRQDSVWQPLDDPPRGWTRGNAWLLLAAADGTRWLGDEFAGSAHVLAQDWLDAYGTAAPPALATAAGPVDTSAAAIAAVALLKLGYPEGETILRQLAAEHMVDGRLLDGCYDLPGGVATRHELIWGAFFVTLGLELLENPAGGCADV